MPSEVDATSAQSALVMGQIWLQRGNEQAATLHLQRARRAGSAAPRCTSMVGLSSSRPGKFCRGGRSHG